MTSYICFDLNLNIFEYLPDNSKNLGMKHYSLMSDVVVISITLKMS